MTQFDGFQVIDHKKHGDLIKICDRGVLSPEAEHFYRTLVHAGPPATAAQEQEIDNPNRHDWDSAEEDAD